MFFPLRVGTDIKKKYDSSGGSIFSLVVMLTGVVGVVAFIMLNSMLMQFTRFSGIISLLIVVLVLGSVLLTVLRIFVFKEDDKIKEETNSKSDTIERFYKIRETENPVIYNDVELFETIEGDVVVCFEVLYGTSNEIKANNSLVALTSLYDVISDSSKNFKVFVTREDFGASKECSNIRSGINNGDQPEVKRVLSEVFDLMLDYNRLDSRLCSTFVVMRLSADNISDLNGIRATMNHLVEGSNNSIRDIRFVGRARYREFIGTYFCVEALDLGSFRNTSVTKTILKKYRGMFYSVDKVEKDVTKFKTEAVKID